MGTQGASDLYSQTQTNQSIFKLQAVIGDLFREYLSQHEFIEIHSPKLQGAATESGASVFKVGYFKSTSPTIYPRSLPYILRR
jgi:aspartyl/asparaginyl-tRNA synthetase